MEWKEITAKLPGLLIKLKQAPLVAINDFKNTYSLKRGVYVLYDGGKPVYAGRSRNIAERLFEHCRPGSKYNQAHFAFRLAYGLAIARGIDVIKTRKDLERDKQFSRIFSEQKTHVRGMKVRAVEISVPALQAVFEIHAAKMLKTRFNDFDTY